MNKKTLARGAFSLVIGIAVLIGAAGCRHEETVAVAETDPADSATLEESMAVDDQAAVEETAEDVAAVPYAQPVTAQPSVVSEAPPAAPQPVPAQIPPPAAQAPPPPPPTSVLVTVPVGTLLRVSLDDHLSSHTSTVGQQFHGTVIQDVAAEGRVAIRSGSRVIGRVTEASPAKKIGGRARLSLDFNTLEVGSVQRPMSAQFAQAGKSQTAKDAAIIGGSTLGGVIIGEAIDKGEGGVIGAIVGGLGGAYAAKQTKAKPVEVPVGTIVDLELTAPVTLEIYPD